MTSFTLGSPAKLTRTHWLLLGGCVLLFLFLRLRWVGHLLVWDEAMTLCTVRSFKAGANDTFSNWFWRHPPLYTLVMLVLRPLQSGLAERTELLSIAFAGVNQLLLFFLNRRVFGINVALWSAFLLALIPGSVFFDVWIKQDHPATAFGLLALLLLFSGRTLYAGLCLGLALLSKQTAVFYGAAVFLLWAGGVCGRRTLKDFLALIFIPALTCAWWYLGVLPRVDPSAGDKTSLWSRLAEATHLRFAVKRDTVWASDWFFYFEKLPTELGWFGLLLAVVGVLFAVKRTLKSRAPESKGADAATGIGWNLWPVALLVPALLLLSVLPNKVSWTVIVLFPAWATLAALGVTAGSSWIMARLKANSLSTGPAAIAILACIVGAAVAIPLTKDYDSLLREIDASQWRGATASRESANKMNEVTKAGERALITSFYYWTGIVPGHADPIFAYYFVKDVQVAIRPHDRPLADVVSDIREFQLDWALLSPEPARANEIFGGLQRTYGLKPYQLSGAWLFHTAEIYRGTSTNAPGR